MVLSNKTKLKKVTSNIKKKLNINLNLNVLKMKHMHKNKTKPSEFSPTPLKSTFTCFPHNTKVFLFLFLSREFLYFYIFYSRKNFRKTLALSWRLDQSLKKAKKSLGNYSSTLLSPLLRKPKPNGKRRINWYKEPKRNSSKRINWSSIIFLKKIESFYNIPPNRKRKK